MERQAEYQNATPVILTNDTQDTPIKSRLWVYTLLFLLSVALVIILLVYVTNQKKTQENLVTSTPTIVPTQVDQKPAGKEYIDENVKFSLIYPSNWIASDPYVGSYPEKTWMVDFSPQASTGGLIVIITRPVDSTYPSSEKWVIGTHAQSYQKVDDNLPTYVDNILAIRLEDTEGNIATFFNTSDTLYYVSLFNGSIHDGYTGSNSDVQMERIVYEDILKSFKVGTNAPTIPTPNSITRAAD